MPEFLLLQGYRTYEVVLLGTMLLGILATPLVVRFARWKGLMDDPGIRRVHGKATPRVGGIAIVFAMLSLTGAVLFLDNEVGRAFRRDSLQIVMLLAAALSLFVVGLLDDLPGLRASTKLLMQLLAAVVVCAGGARLDTISVGADWTLHLGFLGWPLTILWIVAVTNAVNFIDGLDGLAAGICLIAAAAVGAFAVYTGQAVLAVLMLAMLGSLTGFLFLNFSPARIFMGDCGSLFLGFTIASAAVMSVARTPGANFVGMALPALALGVPLLDLLLVVSRRLLLRRSPFAAERRHIHHRLLDRGLAHHEVTLLIYLVTLVAAVAGTGMVFTEGPATLLVFAAVVAALLLMFRLAGALPVRMALAVLSHDVAITRDAWRHRQRFERTQLRLRESPTFDEWWSGICAAARSFDFSRVAMTLTNRDGSRRQLRWPPEPEGPPSSGCITVRLPVPERRSAEPVQVEVDVEINGSLESAGRRVALFGRLIDEHSIAALSAKAPPVHPASGDARPDDNGPHD